MSNVSGLYLYANCFSEIFRITTFYIPKLRIFLCISNIFREAKKLCFWRFYKVFFSDFPEGQYDESIDTGIEQGGITLQGDSTESQDDEPNEPRVKPYREQDIFLPIANVARIMKNSIPQNGKIAKEAKECVQECVSEFISFITSEAAERCQQEKRKTINGEGISEIF